MLPKEKRLRSDRDIKRVYQKGAYLSGRTFTINYIPNRMGLSRLGFVIGKKVEPKAAHRNKIKRQFREAARSLYDVLPTGYDVIINIKKEAKGADFSEIEKDVKASFEKMKKR